jgi:uncharacterized protein (DUF1778 family)
MQRTDRIDLRVSAEDKKALQTVAALQRITVSAFVLSSALKAANEELADRRVFSLTSEQWTDFQEAIDAPVSLKPRLEKLLLESGVFD